MSGAMRQATQAAQAKRMFAVRATQPMPFEGGGSVN
jgi:hypothetical protein